MVLFRWHRGVCAHQSPFPNPFRLPMGHPGGHPAVAPCEPNPILLVITPIDLQARRLPSLSCCTPETPPPTPPHPPASVCVCVFASTMRNHSLFTPCRATLRRPCLSCWTPSRTAASWTTTWTCLSTSPRCSSSMLLLLYFLVVDRWVWGLLDHYLDMPIDLSNVGA